MSGETVFETPWFLQSATTEVGRVNKIVEDRLQRSITEINFKQKKSVEKIERQIDVVKKELKDIRINVDYSSDLDIHGVKVGDKTQPKEQKRSNSTGKIENKKVKKRRKTKTGETQSAPVSVLATETDTDKHVTSKVVKGRTFLCKPNHEKGKRSPGRGRPKKRKHPLDRPHTEINGFLPSIFQNNEDTAVAYYADNDKTDQRPDDDKELKLISIVRQANSNSSNPKLRRKRYPTSRSHFNFKSVER